MSADYDSDFGPGKGKWIAQVHGNERDFEITVVRTDNKHGRKSWGWVSKRDNKLMIACNDGGEMPPNVYQKLKRLAKETAAEMNAKEDAK